MKQWLREEWPFWLVIVLAGVMIVAGAVAVWLQ